MNATSSDPAAGIKAVSREGLRQQLLELDNRFTLLGGAGLFDVLDRAGVLQHRLEQVGDIGYAMSHPPPSGRARLRGDFVRALSAKIGGFACDWTSLWDGEAAKQASLADPFCDEPKWQEWPKSNPQLPPGLDQHVLHRISTAWRLCELGDYPAALELLNALEPVVRRRPSPTLEQYLRLSASLRGRCGLNGGVEALTELVRQRPLTLGVAALGLKIHMNLGLVPGSEAAQWMQKGEELLASAPNAPALAGADFRLLKSMFLNRSGRPLEALANLERVLPHFETAREARFALALAVAELGESHRLLGNRKESRQALQRAQQLQSASGFRGELGRRTMLYRAKLERTPGRRRFWLARAERLLQSCGDRPGLLKTWLLLARVTSSASAARPLRVAIETILEQLPAIQSCARLRQILQHWEEWCTGKPAPHEVTDFFWYV